VAAALAEVVRRLGFPVVEALATTPVTNSRGERAGVIKLAG
jgi:hypothetical protein